MNLNLEVQGHLPHRVLQENHQKLQVVLNFLKLISLDNERGLDFSQAFEFCEHRTTTSTSIDAGSNYTITDASALGNAYAVTGSESALAQADAFATNIFAC